MSWTSRWLQKGLGLGISFQKKSFALYCCALLYCIMIPANVANRAVVAEDTELDECNGDDQIDADEDYYDDEEEEDWLCSFLPHLSVDTELPCLQQCC